jgi:hypothetical protein
MSPRLERELAMDDMADFAQHHRFASIDVGPEPRQPATRHHINVAAFTQPNLIDRFVALPTGGLVAEAKQLQARMLGAQFSTRDFAVVTALIERVEAA